MTQTQNDRTKITFVSNIADVSLSYLLELMIALGSYREGLVLVGGWVPYLLLKEYQPSDVDFRHVGSKDIDIAVNPKLVDEKGYSSILEILKQHGYEPKLDVQGKPVQHSFVKNVVTSKGDEQIQIDFLGPEYGGTQKNKRHQRIQEDFLVRKVRGADVMFDHTVDVALEGKLPDGAEGRTNIKMADIVGIMTMKGIVIGSRYKQKDAYDIHSLVLYYKSGPYIVAEEIRPFKEHGLIKEAIESIHDKFRSREAEGPSWVADFQEAAGELREQVKTQAYLQVQRFLTALYEPPQPPKKEDVQVPDDIPVLDIEPGVGRSGGPSGYFVHFQAINTGDKVAIDCHWGIRGFGYERRSPEVFILRPGKKKQLEYKISDEPVFNEPVPELNIFFEYQNNKGVSFFTRRELVLEKVPSGAFYNITKVGQFHPAVVLTDSKIRRISEPYVPQGNFTTEVIVDVEVKGKIKQIKMGFAPGLPGVFGFLKGQFVHDDEKVKAALSELAQRKVRNMLRTDSLNDYIFSSDDLPDRNKSGFDAYVSLRDSLDR
ncbi:TPA: hypothetical protein DCY43_03820 [candidate division WWE3 bacterium]|uniref:Nucleotidyl transferase AbiEii/AbiGii toxin family protein n=1 Tax=candidate division WWE3 bacterium TaxID=2053526 RepID=A0A351JU69_UNCKA|nr:hypothetical protein [candidate division WWE3 bacterium]